MHGAYLAHLDGLLANVDLRGLSHLMLHCSGFKSEAVLVAENTSCVEMLRWNPIEK